MGEMGSPFQCLAPLDRSDKKRVDYLLSIDCLCAEGGRVWMTEELFHSAFTVLGINCIVVPHLRVKKCPLFQHFIKFVKSCRKSNSIITHIFGIILLMRFSSFWTTKSIQYYAIRGASVMSYNQLFHYERNLLHRPPKIESQK